MSLILVLSTGPAMAVMAPDEDDEVDAVEEEGQLP
jgi:hypothetical protein